MSLDLEKLKKEQTKDYTYGLLLEALKLYNYLEEQQMNFKDTEKKIEGEKVVAGEDIHNRRHAKRIDSFVTSKSLESSDISIDIGKIKRRKMMSSR